jgi:uncharacterized hydrophobic protein (TIGR00271 family)
MKINIKILDPFRMRKDKEEFKVIRAHIEKDVLFQGTNLWILFFAILVASLGLNMNSTAVVIGAMLISPLMGPIVGIGFGVAINDLSLIRKAFRNYLFAAAVGLVASTVYFLLSPIEEAHSEILSRTLPTIYDVLIALFGGFAGILALSSKQKGNVIPGVAIATALMPPLCTAGYGLATGQFAFFLGAFYLYLINSVFIALATLLTCYLMKFPVKKYEDPKVEKKERIFIWTVVILTLIPSLYLGYEIVNQYKFKEKANRFISTEAIFPNDYLLDKEIDAKLNKITLTYGGKEILKSEIDELKSKLKYYELEHVDLEIRQGFALLEDKRSDEKINQLALTLDRMENERQKMKAGLDSMSDQKLISKQVFDELQIQQPGIIDAVIQPVIFNTDSALTQNSAYLVLIHMRETLKSKEALKLEEWLKVRLRNKDVKLVIQKADRADNK